MGDGNAAGFSTRFNSFRVSETNRSWQTSHRRHRRIGGRKASGFFGRIAEPKSEIDDAGRPLLSRISSKNRAVKSDQSSAPLFKKALPFRDISPDSWNGSQPHTPSGFPDPQRFATYRPDHAQSPP